MIWQWLVVAFCVMLALVYVGQAAMRISRPKTGGCGGGCGCGTIGDDKQVTIIPPEQLSLRRK